MKSIRIAVVAFALVISQATVTLAQEQLCGRSQSV